jgi:hypothetical protein
MQSPMTLGNMRANSVNTLTLKRASTHRPGGPWSEDDYDVYDGEWIIGRIARTSIAPQGCPWFWSITEGIRARTHKTGIAPCPISAGKQKFTSAIVCPVPA